MSDEFDTWNAEAITCPYCGFVEHDVCEYDESSTTYLCGRCDRESDLCVNITYTTKKQGSPVPTNRQKDGDE